MGDASELVAWSRVSERDKKITSKLPPGAKVSITVAAPGAISRSYMAVIRKTGKAPKMSQAF